MSLGFAPSQTLLKSSKSADEISPPPTHGLLARTPMWVLDKLADFRYGKELHIYVVRHGQSEGNIDRTLYARQADHSIRLTERGILQAQAAGAFMADHLLHQKSLHPGSFGKIRLWHSPYYRARETARHMLYPLGQAFNHAKGEISDREDSFLYEQKAGLFDAQEKEEFANHHPREAADYAKAAEFDGRSYAISPLGESRLGTSFRAGPLFGKILRDLRERDIRQVIIVCHGVTAPGIVMNWMRYTPEWLDAEQTPQNCWIRHIHGTTRRGYSDEGYVHGEGAPLREPLASSGKLRNPGAVYMIRPGRTSGIIPSGINVIDPYASPDP